MANTAFLPTSVMLFEPKKRFYHIKIPFLQTKQQWLTALKETKTSFGKSLMIHITLDSYAKNN
jgi:hypothetical protein